MTDLRPVILLVEDDKHLAEMYKTVFEKERFIVEQTADGNEALKMIAQEKPDVVLLDIMLPGKDGIEILQIIKSNPSYSNIAVLVFTAHPKEEFKRLAENAGAIDFISKSETMPVDIVRKVKKIIGWGK
jgi:DNA-binding response OmpR family regulator